MKIKIILIKILVIFSFFNLEAKEIVIATTYEQYPPFLMLGKNGEMVGFDIEIITRICKIKELPYKIIYQPFDVLILGLQTDKFDVIIGGITANKKRSKQVDFSQPYIVDKMAFIFKKKSNFNLSNKYLKNKVIGVQSGTVFEKYLNDKFGDIIQLKNYVYSNNALLDIENERIHAYIGDDSVLRYWKKNSEKENYDVLTIQEDSYVYNIAIAVKRGNHSLLNKINDGLTQLKRRGELQSIRSSFIDKQKINVKNLFFQINKSIIITIKIALLGLLLGLLLSLVFLALLVANKPLNVITSFFTSVIRGLPELIIIMITFFVIPSFIKKYYDSINISPIISTSFGLALIFGSYISEIFYKFYLNFPRGQIKAALSLNLPYRFIFFKIKLPQILQQSFPIISNQWLILLKDTSLVSLVGVHEIMGKTTLSANATEKHLSFFTYVAFLYLCLIIIFNKIFPFIYQYCRKKLM